MARSLAMAALRARPRQGLLVAALAAVVTGAGALGPLYARAVEQSVLRSTVAGAGADARLVVTDASAPVLPPDDLTRQVGEALPRALGTGVAGGEAVVQVADRTIRLTTRDGICEHVELTAGRCPVAPGEVLVSSRTARTLSVGRSDRLVLTSGSVTGRATVVGVYDGLDPSAPYWAGRSTSSGARGAAAMDDLLTTWPTLAATPWPGLQTHLDARLQARAVDLRGVAELRAQVAAVSRVAEESGAYATTEIPALLAAADDQRDRAREVILLLTVQLAVLGLVVLAFVGAAVAEQRRPEIALARLRGLGTAGAAGLLLREVGLLVAAGGAAGFALAYAVAEAARARWLAPGVALELRPAVTGAALAAVAAGLLGILIAATPALRQPLTSLLRRVPPRTSGLRVGIVEGAVAAAAAAGVVTLLTGERGAVALLAPGLLALATGLLLSQLVGPVAAPLARRALRRGRLPRGLAALQLARRPSLRRLIAIVTVAVALPVFAADTWSVADRNRTAAAELDAGAAVVLGVDATSAQQLRTALLDIDPHGSFATPVVAATSGTPSGPRTLAVEPEAFGRIARWGAAGNRPSAAAFRALSPPSVPPVPLPSGTVPLTVEATYVRQVLPRPLRLFTDPQRVTLEVVLAQRSGAAESLSLGVLRPGRGTYTSTVRCDGCTLEGFVVQRRLGDSYPLAIRLTIDAVRAGTRPVDLGPATPGAWQVLPSQSLPTTATVAPGPPLTIYDPTSFQSAEVRRGDVPAVPPALVAGDVPPPFRTTTKVTTALALAPDLSGSDQVYEVVQRIPTVPGAGSRTVLTDLRTLQRTSSAGGTQPAYDVWLARDAPDQERALRKQLAAHGLAVITRDSSAQHERALAADGPALALRLALVAGVAALIMAAAALLVGVATSGTTRARDLAGLRVVGVPAGPLRRGAVLEHLVIAVAGVVAGSTAGLVAAQAALPNLPLLAGPTTRVPTVLHPAWAAALGTAVAALLLLSGVAVAVGRAVAGSAAPHHLREQA